MMAPAATHAEQIASSAAHAAWAGAAASTFASVVALGVALWAARVEDGRRRLALRRQETAFAFGMVGALEMVKPLINEAQADVGGEIAHRRFTAVVDHARTIAEAALAIQVFDMQMLRDAYLIRGVLNGLRSLSDERPTEAVPNRAIGEIVDPVLGGVLDADDRFFARLPKISEVRGIEGRTPIHRAAS